MTEAPTWYVIKRDDGRCDIVPYSQLPNPDQSEPESQEKRYWGPFQTPAEAIARRVGLIRAGKCHPI